MTDNGLAALAAALQEADDSWNQMESTDGRWRDFIAAAILGERGVFLPDGLPHDCQTSIRLNQGMAETNERLASEITEQAATIATLRADAAATIDRWAEALTEIATLRADLAHCERAWDDAGTEIATLRAALDGLVEAVADPLSATYSRSVAIAAARAALATAKEAGG